MPFNAVVRGITNDTLSSIENVTQLATHRIVKINADRGIFRVYS